MAASQYGRATIYGIDGTVTVGSALAVVPESIDHEDTAEVEEFKDGNGELIGAAVRDKRFRVNITVLAKSAAAGSGALQSALGGFVLPAIWSKVTLASFADTTSPSLNINGDYIYAGGATRGLSRGQATYRIPLFKPTTSPLTTDQLVTLAS